jgi:hypothetical protein
MQHSVVLAGGFWIVVCWLLIVLRFVLCLQEQYIKEKQKNLKRKWTTAYSSRVGFGMRCACRRSTFNSLVQLMSANRPLSTAHSFPVDCCFLLAGRVHHLAARLQYRSVTPVTSAHILMSI